MPKRPTARQQEIAAALRRTPRTQRLAPADPVRAFLLRRGIEAALSAPDVPIPPGAQEEAVQGFADLLGSYAFRLFLRGAILRPRGFSPAETTSYVDPAKSLAFAHRLVGLGFLRPLPRGRFELVKPARSFGGTLEWYVARELERRLGFCTATALSWLAKGVGGDLDVVAAADGRLVYLELKSGPPKHLSAVEVVRFFDRLRALRPDVALFVLDTSLRLSDKVLPMLGAELARRGKAVEPRRLVRDVWALTPALLALNAKGDLVGNIGVAVAEGLRGLAPEPP